MKYFKRLLFVFGFTALSVLGYFSYFNSTVKRVDIVYTSDGHGNVLPSIDYSRQEPVQIGGMAALGGYLSQIKRPFLLLDSGDIFQGTPEGILSRGQLVIELMNILGYHAVAAGNHDFDFGQATLENLSKAANFPFLGANIITTETGRIPDYIEPHTIYNINNVRVGIIGTITEDMASISIAKNIEGLEFVSPSAAVDESVAELSGQTDIVLLLSHSGLNSDREIASRLEGVDVILSGHSHIPLKRPIVKNNILISQPGSNFKYAGQFTLYYCKAAKKVITYKNSMTPLYTKNFKLDSRVKEVIKDGMENIQKTTGIDLERVIGISEKRLSKNLYGEARKHGELALGNWQTDIMREETKSDFAFQNSGGIRDDIPEGDITVRDIWKLSPFGNKLVTMELTGAQIRGLLEQSAAHRYSNLQISGLRYLYNGSLPEGQRILNIIVRDEEGQNREIDPEQSYKVVTNSFLAGGGDGYSLFKEGSKVEELPLMLRDVQIEYIEENSPIGSEVQGRIINVALGG